MNPLALVNEIRKFYTGSVILCGCLSTGRDIGSAQMIGADYAYMGTRFISTQESRAQDPYKQMVNDSVAADIVYTRKISGVFANFMKKSLLAAGFDEKALAGTKDIDFGSELQPPEEGEAGAWRDIWSAGQGVGSIDSTP